MPRRFDIPLEELESRSRVANDEQVHEQVTSRRQEPLLAGPVHPYGDGATGADGDGD